MHLSHKSTHKYIPNQLFQKQNGLEIHDYKQAYSHRKTQDKINVRKILGAETQQDKQKSIFKNITNYDNDNNSNNLKENQKNPICFNKDLTLENNFFKQENLQQQNNNQNSPKLRRKKASPKKTNMKNLFIQFDDRSSSEQSDSQKTIDKKDKSFKDQNHKTEEFGDIVVFDSENNIQQSNCTARQPNLQNTQKNGFENQNSKKQLQINTQLKPSSIKQKNQNRKFHFLHNQINFQSSSQSNAQQIMDQNQKQGSMKRSNSSEGQGQKVHIQMPKLRPKNNFMKNLNFQDSQQQQSQFTDTNQAKANLPDHIKQQQSEKNIGQNQQQQQQKSGSLQNLTIPAYQFIRSHVQQEQQYLKTPIPLNTSIELIVKRDKSKLKSEHVQYYIYDARSLKQLVVVIKKSSGYEMYAKLNIQCPKAHPDLKYLVGKIESSFFGNQFNLKYVKRRADWQKDIHKNTKSQSQTKQANKQFQYYSPQQQIASTIVYETNIFGLNGPRKINIYIPSGKQTKYYGQKSLEKLFQKNCNHKIQKFVNKQAKWNNTVQSYVLNMKGKAKLSSVKNFVIVKDFGAGVQNKIRNNTDEQKNLQKQKDRSYLLFGKVSRDIFNLVISGPFTILQGISVALSTFQRKLTCE